MVQIIVLATLQPLQALITVQTTCGAAMVFPLSGLSLFSQSSAGAVSVPKGGFGGFGGWGGNGGNGTNGAGFQGWATRADINEGFALNDIQNGIRGIQQGICDSTYALNNTMQSGFNGVNVGMLQGFNGIQQAINADTVAGMQNTNALQSQLCYKHNLSANCAKFY